MKDLAALLSPRSIAIVGASNDMTILRGRTLKVMLGHAYTGRIYPVSRSHSEIQGRKAYSSVDALPERVDLAVLIIPAEFVAAELERCGRCGIKAALILTSGFAEERGEEGAHLQTELKNIAERYEMIVCGPNTEGFANTAAALCPTFSPVVDALSVPLTPSWRQSGHVAVIAQSGGVGFAFFDRGRPKEIPFSYVVTTGNEVCLEVFDVVDYLLDEGRTDVFLLFLENIKNADTFKRAAEKALRMGKPIIVAKIGRSEAGRRAAASHTAALAGEYEMYRAMFRHYGVIEGADIEEMVDLAAAFSFHRQNLPPSKRVGIGTPSGGAGGWMADACTAAGLAVPELDPTTRAQIDVHLPKYGTSQNPVDCTAQAIRQLGYSEMARMISLSPQIDSVVMIASTRSAELLEREHKNLKHVASTTAKPILFWSYTQPCAAAVQALSEAGYPLFTNMRNCARAIAAMAEYRECRERFMRIRTERVAEDIQRIGRTRTLLRDAILCEYEVAPILREYGIDVAPAILAETAEDAVQAARALNTPVALKVQSPKIPHKTDVGALALNLSGAESIRLAFQTLMERVRQRAPHADVLGVLVQSMAPHGIEMVVGIRRDALFGPMLMLGFGGVHVEVLRDVVWSPVPTTREEVRDSLRELRAHSLLEGARGPAADIGALIELVVRLSQLAFEHRDVVEELELNPVIVHSVGQGISIVDALAKVRAH